MSAWSEGRGARSTASRRAFDRPPLARHLGARAALSALLVALAACLYGAFLVAGDAAPSPRRRTVTASASPSPIATLPPDGPRLTGIIDQVDARYDRLVIDVQGRRLAYGLNAQTLYPDPCLQAATLRRGRRVTLTLPWYMGGQAYILAVTPSGGCGSSR